MEFFTLFSNFKLMKLKDIYDNFIGINDFEWIYNGEIGSNSLS